MRAVNEGSMFVAQALDKLKDFRGRHYKAIATGQIDYTLVIDEHIELLEKALEILAADIC